MSNEDLDSFEVFPTNMSPTDLKSFRERHSTTTECVDQGRKLSTQSENGTNPLPSPLYYQKHSLCSPRSSPRSLSRTSLGSFASLQRYCSSLSIGSHLNLQAGQETIPEFVIPSSKAPPRSSRMTATGELVYFIKKNRSRDYQALIKDEMVLDQMEQSLEDKEGDSVDVTPLQLS